MQTVGKLCARRFVARAGSQRWPIRAVTGTMAEQERDVETGCSGVSLAGGQRPQAGRPETTRS